MAEAVRVHIAPRRGGGLRDAAAGEAFRLILGALAAVSRRAGGVHWMNVCSDGRQMAVAVIPNAMFSERPDGNTTLGEILDDTPARA